MIVTVAERKARKVRRLLADSRLAMAELMDFACAHQGRFVVFGSTASGTLGHASDFDVLVDFPAPVDRVAYLAAEDICIRHGLIPDIHYLAEASEPLRQRIREHGLVLQ